MPSLGRCSSPFQLVAALALAGLPGSAHGAPPLLLASFNDKTADAPIATGGAAVGEPVSIDSLVTAIVRAAPLSTKSLEIQDNSSAAAGYARFELVGGAEVTSGFLSIAFELWFPEFESFAIAIREHGTSAYDFADLIFTTDATVGLFDAGGYLGVVGSYATTQVLAVRFDYDLTAGTYDLYLDGVRVVNDQPHDVSAAGRGIGAVLFGANFDANLAGSFFVDSIVIATDGLVFADNLEAGSTVYWSSSG